MHTLSMLLMNSPAKTIENTHFGNIMLACESNSGSPSIRSDLRVGGWSENRGAYQVRFAQSDQDRRDVQALRYAVFAEELGARVEGADRGLDIDPLDELADHLMVVECESGECVGSYRLATREQVQHAEGFYTQRIFDLSRLDESILDEGVELGRACVGLQHRTRGVLQLLLRGIGAYLIARQKRFLFGCGSVGLKDLGEARSVICQIDREGWLDATLDVKPTEAYTPSLPEAASGGVPEITALLYAYSSIGARLAASPAYDPDFKTLDFFVLLDLEHVEPRTYARYCGSR